MSTFVVGGTVIYSLSTAPTMAPLILSKGERTTVSVTRVFPEELGLELQFRREPWEKRPELGSYTTRGDPWKDGYLEFESPGEPVLIVAETGGGRVAYEAMPNSGWSERIIWRELVPFADDGRPNRFVVPVKSNTRLRLPAGTPELTLTVAEVGKAIEGESVVVIVRAPVGFKGPSSHNYVWVSLFAFWPILWIPLLIYLAILLKPRPQIYGGKEC
jgi:hypothetical protein